MDALREVHINAPRNIRDSWEPHGKEQRAHIYLNHLHHFSPGISFVSKRLLRPPNANPSELRSSGNIPAEHPYRHLFTTGAWLSRPLSKNGCVKVPSVYCTTRDASSSWGFSLSYSLFCKDFISSGGAGLLTTKMSTIPGHKYRYWRLLKGLSSLVGKYPWIRKRNE